MTHRQAGVETAGLTEHGLRRLHRDDVTALREQPGDMASTRACLLYTSDAADEVVPV